jgi:hypothetical protein
VIATARDVDGAEVLDRAEAAGLHDGLPARGWIRHPGAWGLEQDASERVVDLLIVPVLALLAQAPKDSPQADL